MPVVCIVTHKVFVMLFMCLNLNEDGPFYDLDSCHAKENHHSIQWCSGPEGI